eukprot:TRINITY_DN2383_c0_g1_i3.p1 TRINITY_DN2383_c0_g1~~TRINITY_DN2383_c0_g1_i3.p1  ORF type:complete len:122 (-),score=23.95 TRINITY_DN2383_c0_g1_i3:323-637(-)
MSTEASLLADIQKLCCIVNNDQEKMPVFFDVKLKTDDGKMFFASKTYLAATSKYFENMFGSGMKETNNQTDYLMISEVPSENLWFVLRYLTAHPFTKLAKEITI